MAKTKPQEKKAKKLTLPLIIVSLLMILVFKLGFIFFVISLLPSIVSYYVDNTRNKYSFHTVFSCNLAGVMPFMADILIQGRTDAVIQGILSDSANWLVAYGGAAVGWVLVFIAPFVAQQMVVSMHARQISRLRGQQKILIKKWGEQLEKESADVIS